MRVQAICCPRRAPTSAGAWKVVAASVAAAPLEAALPSPLVTAPASRNKGETDRLAGYGWQDTVYFVRMPGDGCAPPPDAHFSASVLFCCSVSIGAGAPATDTA